MSFSDNCELLIEKIFIFSKELSIDKILYCNSYPNKLLSMVIVKFSLIFQTKVPVTLNSISLIFCTELPNII